MFNGRATLMAPTASPALSSAPSAVEWLTLLAAVLAVAATVFGVVRAELATKAGWQRDLRLRTYDNFFEASDSVATLVLTRLVRTAALQPLSSEDRGTLELAQRKYNAAFHSVLIVASLKVAQAVVTMNLAAADDIFAPAFSSQQQFSPAEARAWAQAAARLQQQLFDLVAAIREELGFMTLPAMQAEARIIDRADRSAPGSEGAPK